MISALCGRSILFAICLCSQGVCQVIQTPNPGVSPFQSYSSQDTYNIDLATGQINGQIQFASYPQLGRLHPLNYYVQLNSPAFTMTETCDSTTGGCYIYYDLGVTDSGASVNTNYVAVKAKQETWSLYDGNANHAEIRYSVADPTGNIHALLSDSARPNILHSVDGSGYSLFFPPGSNATNYGSQLVRIESGKVYDASGIAYTPYDQTYNNGNVTYIPATISDPNNNMVTLPNGATLGSVGIVDSIGRQLPLPPTSDTSYMWSNDVSHCPDLGDSSQHASRSVSLNLISAGGAPMPILLCYSGISFHLAVGNNFSSDLEIDQALPNGPGTFVMNTFGGFTALQSIVFPDDSYYGFLYDASVLGKDGSGTIISASEAYGTLRKIIYPTGASASFTFGALIGVGTNNEIAAGQGPYPSTYYRPVASVRRDDANGNVGDTTYQRGTIANHPEQFTVDEIVAENVTRHTFEDLSGTQNFLQNYEVQTDYYEGAAQGTALKTIHRSYQYQPAITFFDEPSAVAMVMLSTVKTDLNGQNQSTQAFSYPVQGALNRIVCYGAVSYGCGPALTNNNTSVASLTSYSSSPSQTIVSDSGGGQISRSISQPFFTMNGLYKDNNILDIVGQTQIFDAGDQKKAQATYGYDESGSPQGTIGNQTSVTTWLDTTGQNIVTSTKYNNQGMPTLTTDGNGNQTAFQDYQCSGLYPTTVTQAYQSSTTASQSTTASYDCNASQLLSSTDPNGIKTQYIYNDPLDRLSEVDSAVGTLSATSIVVAYPSQRQTDISVDKDVKGDGSIKVSTVRDGFGRVIHQTSSSGTVVDTVYDARGNKTSVSNPHSASSASTDGITTYSYDALGRVRLQCNPDNRTTGPCSAGNSYQEWIYNGNNIIYYDERRNSWQWTSDAVGRLSSVIEPGNFQTAYTYDAFGNIGSVTQHGNGSVGALQTRSFNYDSLSRLTSATNPETGTVGYSYDLNGNLHTKTDSRGVTITYSYDGLNRLLSRVYSGTNAAATLTSCFQYDTAKGGKGLLGSEWTQVGVCSSSAPSNAATLHSILAYDPMRRVANDKQCHLQQCTSGHFYSSFVHYDLTGNQTFYSIAEPLISLSRTYDSAGLLRSVNSSLYGGQYNSYPANLFSVQEYSSGNAMTKMKLGPNINITRTYDNRLRITGQTVTYPSQP